MTNTSRTAKSLKNLFAAFGGQAAGILISFISRRVFLYTLSKEYLGINGLFANILSVLSLAELGVGSAMSYSLYRPLAENDIPLIKSLMRLYRRAYTAVGAAILLLSLLLAPFYTFFMDEVPDIPHLTAIYLLYAANTGISYFFIYKRTLIICDQKRYVATIYRYFFYFLLNIAQMIILLLTENYLLFTSVQLVFTVLENIAVSKAADKMYPYLKEDDAAPLPENTKAEIKRNISAMMMHKIGGIVVNSTDNILISKLIGLACTGIYSNYSLITSALSTVINQVFSSVTASVGNLNASYTDKTRLMRSFYRMFFLNFWIYGFSLSCLVSLFNPFITLWLGDEGLTFDMGTVVCISAVFYLSGMRKTVLGYREAAGVFYYDRYKPLAESAVNLVFSVILAKHMGAAGIFLGTVISNAAICMWVEPCVLYKHVLGGSPSGYFSRLGIYTAAAAGTCAGTYFLCGQVIIPSEAAAFAVKVLICAFFPNTVFLCIFGRTEEFGYFKRLAADILGGIFKKTRK